MMTHRKHLPDTSFIPETPNIYTRCERIVPPSEITTRKSLVSCQDCRRIAGLD